MLCDDYRPKTFSAVVGQSVSTRILRNSISMNRVHGAYLFSGPRGTGKTSLARIFARSLNCESFNGDPCCACLSCLDSLKGAHASIMELDAASHNGVDDVREIREFVKQKVIHRYRVLILDEAHMLSKSAQAALLKILEEPPTNHVFILVTTSPDDLTETVRSRCLSMPLMPLSEAEIEESLWNVIRLNGYEADPDLVHALALNCRGSLRDAYQLLDRAFLMSEGRVIGKDLMGSCGFLTKSEYADLANILLARDPAFILEELTRLYREGVDLELMFNVGVPDLLRDFLAVVSKAEVTYRCGLDKERMIENMDLSFDEVKNRLRAWEQARPLMNGDNVLSMFEAMMIGGITECGQVC